MGIIALIILIIIEITYAVICIRTKSNHAKEKSTIRIGLFILFVILTLASIIQWSFRWYAFGALLLIWSILGMFTLMRSNQKERLYKPIRVITNAVLMSLLAFLTLIPALVFPQGTPLPVTGPYSVETTIYTYTDENRVETYVDTGDNRKITVQYWYPGNTDGTYPLVIFSHGSFGVVSSNISLYRELASHGYVVCSIGHTYQGLFTTDTNGKTTLIDQGFMREVSIEDAKIDRQQSYEFYTKWMTIRAGDINFVIDTALGQAKQPAANLPYRLIDPTKIGVMGHSLGGSAALAVGRMRSDIGAVMALEAPFMADILGASNGEFVWDKTPYPVPVLNIYSDSSWSHLAEWPQYAENNFLLTGQNPTAYNVHLQGALHLNLTDLALTSPFFTQVLNGQKASIDSRQCLLTINQLTLGFFDQYLKSLGEFKPQKAY